MSPLFCFARVHRHDFRFYFDEPYEKAGELQLTLDFRPTRSQEANAAVAEAPEPVQEEPPPVEEPATVPPPAPAKGSPAVHRSGLVRQKSLRNEEDDVFEPDTTAMAEPAPTALEVDSPTDPEKEAANDTDGSLNDLASVFAADAAPVQASDGFQRRPSEAQSFNRGFSRSTGGSGPDPVRK